MLPEEDEVGLATGAAWTATGGEIMFIEVNLMPGKGSLTLTGQLGEVMQESAQAALTYTRSQAQKTWHPPGSFRTHRHPYPFAGRGCAQRWAIRRRLAGRGLDLGLYQPAHTARCQHDW